jgi:hypothetical protein
MGWTLSSRLSALDYDVFSALWAEKFGLLRVVPAIIGIAGDGVECFYETQSVFETPQPARAIAAIVHEQKIRCRLRSAGARDAVLSVGQLIEQPRNGSVASSETVQLPPIPTGTFARK